MITQTTNEKPKPFVIKNGIMYKLIKQCNDTLYLYENMQYGFKETFTNFDLGMIKEANEKPNNKPHRIKF